MSRSDPPNILYIHSHDTGRYVQPYGYQVPTPNIQHLADQGVLFRRGVLRRADLLRQPCLAPHRPVLPQQRHARARPPRLGAQRLWPAPCPRAAPAGYRSTLIGEQHISEDPHVTGYDEVIEVSSHHATDVAPIATEAIADARGALLPLCRVLRDPPQLRAPTSVRDTLYSLGPANLPDTPATREDMAAFKASAPLARPGNRGGAERLASPWPHREHACDLHYRSWPRLPKLEGDPVRPRHRRDVDHARAGRLRGRPSDRRDGLSSRHLPDALRARRSRPSAVPAGHLAPAARRRSHHRTPRRDIHGNDLPRRLPAASRGPD